MSDDKGSKNRHITVLQDIVLNRNFTHPVLQKLQSGYEEKNTFKSTTGTKRRYTDSVYMFDEEPVFSDSDTEIEYHKIVMASMPNAKEYLQGMNESRQSNIVEDQSNLTSEEMKILKFIRTCSVTDIENVNDDFKQFVDLCKQLQSKYPLPKFGDESPESVRVSNQLCNKISTTEPYIANECQEGFLPSRSGSVTGNNVFTSEVSFDSGVSLLESIKSSGDTPINVQVPRRSTRTRKPVRLNSSGVLIGSVASLKNRHTKGTNGTDKKKHREKTNIQEHHVTSVTRRKAQITALQKENVNDDFKQFVDLCKQLQSKYPLPKFGDESPESVRVSNQLCNKISTTEPYIANECQEGFLPSRSGSVTGNNVFTSEVSFDSGVSLLESIKSSGDTPINVQVPRRSTRTRKPVRLNSSGVLIGSVASLKNRHTKGTNGTDKKKHREKTNIQEHHVTSVTRRKAQITALQKGGGLYFNAALPLPQKELRSLARNWMQFNKNTGKAVFVDSVKRKLRRLYSPEEWLHSEEISHLCKMNETMNRKSL